MGPKKRVVRAPLFKPETKASISQPKYKKERPTPFTKQTLPSKPTRASNSGPSNSEHESSPLTSYPSLNSTPTGSPFPSRREQNGAPSQKLNSGKGTPKRREYGYGTRKSLDEPQAQGISALTKTLNETNSKIFATPSIDAIFMTLDNAFEEQPESTPKPEEQDLGKKNADMIDDLMGMLSKCRPVPTGSTAKVNSITTPPSPSPRRDLSPRVRIGCLRGSPKPSPRDSVNGYSSTAEESKMSVWESLMERKKERDEFYLDLAECGRTKSLQTVDQRQKEVVLRRQSLEASKVYSQKQKAQVSRQRLLLAHKKQFENTHTLLKLERNASWMIFVASLSRFSIFTTLYVALLNTKEQRRQEKKAMCRMRVAMVCKIERWKRHRETRFNQLLRELDGPEVEGVDPEDYQRRATPIVHHFLIRIMVFQGFHKIQCYISQFYSGILRLQNLIRSFLVARQTQWLLLASLWDKCTHYMRIDGRALIDSTGVRLLQMDRTDAKCNLEAQRFLEESQDVTLKYPTISWHPKLLWQLDQHFQMMEDSGEAEDEIDEGQLHKRKKIGKFADGANENSKMSKQLLAMIQSVDVPKQKKGKFGSKFRDAQETIFKYLCSKAFLNNAKSSARSKNKRPMAADYAVIEAQMGLLNTGDPFYFRLVNKINHIKADMRLRYQKHVRDLKQWEVAYGFMAEDINSQSSTNSPESLKSFNTANSFTGPKSPMSPISPINFKSPQSPKISRQGETPPRFAGAVHFEQVDTFRNKKAKGAKAMNGMNALRNMGAEFTIPPRPRFMWIMLQEEMCQVIMECIAERLHDHIHLGLPKISLVKEVPPGPS